MKEIGGILESLMEANVPTVLILCGIGILFLSLVGRFGTFIEIRKERQKPATYIGGLLLAVGLGLHLLPFNDKPNPPATVDSTPEFPRPVQPPAGSAENENNDATYWVIAGSFLDAGSADARRAELQTAGIQALTVDSDDYSFLTDGYRTVIVPVPGRESLSDVLEKVRAVVPDAFPREQN